MAMKAIGNDIQKKQRTNNCYFDRQTLEVAIIRSRKRKSVSES